ncbi:VOC family protein [Phycicoccus sp. BSK3Z-2]|uniref:VOC family protein n=1 Tax=Phycicoccus avicenniae TaxID=2828860 RepID=A0A941D6W6_9MICO|nr:VOC family protein [Phycicoccus avicenniae]MBR7742726.1 VOC family protein [Phycicoccus avicenniae]
MDLTPGWMQLFLDVPRRDVEVATAFWSEVTGWSVSPTRGEEGQFVTLLPGSAPAWVKVQAVGGPGGVHLDLNSADRERAVARALDLGARVLRTYQDVVVMASPGGFTFCQTLVDPTDPAPRMTRSPVSVLDQVCLDVPADAWDAETAFWRDLTGRGYRRGLRPEFEFLDDGAADGPLRILLQRLDDPGGPVRAHPDLAVADRAAEEARHVAAGAEVRARFERWTVLRAPGGQVYCLTDRDPLTGLVRRAVQE